MQFEPTPGDPSVILRIEIERSQVQENINIDEIRRAAANVVGNAKIVGSEAAEAMRGIKSYERVQVIVRRACPTDRIKVTQVAPLAGQMILTDHEYSRRFQRETRRAIDTGFFRVPGSSGGNQPKSSFQFDSLDTSDAQSAPKREFESRNRTPAHGMRAIPFTL